MKNREEASTEMEAKEEKLVKVGNEANMAIEMNEEK